MNDELQYDIIKVIIHESETDDLEGFILYCFPECGEEYYTFEKVLKIAKEKGFDVNKSFIEVICENPLEGVIYRYNVSPIDRGIYKYGETKGYA